MQRITRDQITIVFDHHLPPVARVQPGETFVVETEDSRGGRTRTPETTTPEFLLAMRRQGYYGNPVTGPIYVVGAMPGDTLAVHIHSQECDTLGYMGYWPFLFHLEDFFDKPDTTLVEIRDGNVIVKLSSTEASGSRGFSRQSAKASTPENEIHIPVRPMIGTIGTTPAVEAILSGGMGRHGGNLDTQEVCAGSTIYLPVYVEGALLGLGDCHAIQSDGELNEVEMRSVITLSCDVIKGRSPLMSWPRIETGDSLVTVAMASPLEEAARLALREMILWLAELTGLSKREAFYLVGLAGHARPGQVQVPLYSMRCLMPKEFIPKRR